MVCENCGKNSNGIKINGKLFCPNCGEVIGVPEASPKAPAPIKNDSLEEPIPKVISKDGQEITPDDIKKEVDLLTAEEEVLEVIEKEGKSKKVPEKKVTGKKTILKHNRERVGNNHKKNYVLLYNEPDPITEPELPPPHDDMITEKDADISIAGTGDEETYPLIDKEKLEAIKEKRERHKEVLASFLKSGASRVTEKKHRKKERQFRYKLFFSIFLPLILLLGFIGLVFYVNLYGNRAEPAKEKAEETVDFLYQKPEYIPPGYELSYLTTGSKEKINYHYLYTSNKEKTLDIIITKTEVGEEDLFSKIVKPLGSSYSQVTRGDTSLWYTGDDSLFFISRGLLYEITASNDISREELTKIADGLL